MKKIDLEELAAKVWPHLRFWVHAIVVYALWDVIGRAHPLAWLDTGESRAYCLSLLLVPVYIAVVWRNYHYRAVADSAKRESDISSESSWKEREAHTQAVAELNAIKGLCSQERVDVALSAVQQYTDPLIRWNRMFALQAIQTIRHAARDVESTLDTGDIENEEFSNRAKVVASLYELVAEVSTKKRIKLAGGPAEDQAPS